MSLNSAGWLDAGANDASTASAHPPTISLAGIRVALWTATAVVLLLGYARDFLVESQIVPVAPDWLRLINLDGEMTIPAWYSSMLMWSAAVLLAVLAVYRSDRRVVTGIWWWSLSALFFYLSLDETASIHENLGPDLLGAYQPLPIFAFNWVIVVGPAVVIVGLAFLPFLFRLPKSARLRIMAAGFVYVCGAYGMELVGGYVAATNGGPILYDICTAIEESLEMIGLSLFLTALLDFLASETPLLTLAPRRRDGGDLA
ncbi:MAG TPA: hypothetical protein VHA70_12400 [Bauldia sp.]|nr:hypothetical protein [Bauldia sp.]